MPGDWDGRLRGIGSGRMRVSADVVSLALWFWLLPLEKMFIEQEATHHHPG